MREDRSHDPREGHMSTDTTSPEAVGMSSDRLTRIAPVMESYVAERGVVGISTMISRRGEIVHAEQFGFQDREAGTPMAPDTIFRIYSMTKPVVSTALMMLHEEGAFQLEHPVAQYLPAFAATKVLADDGTLVDQARPMQIRDVLSHTSGLTYDFMADNPVAQMYRDARIMNDATRPLDALIDELATLPLAFQPGTRWHYSVGIDVAARLIEVLSGQSARRLPARPAVRPARHGRHRVRSARRPTRPGLGDVRPPRPRRRELLGDPADGGGARAASTNASTSRPPTRRARPTCSSAAASDSSRPPPTT
jgi:CubicO group peptidase (beta-lactamase class C family)